MITVKLRLGALQPRAERLPMLIALLVSMQSAAMPEPRSSRELAEFDLQNVVSDHDNNTGTGCDGGPAASDEIVVCASRDREPGRLNEIQGPVFAAGTGRAEVDLGNGATASAEVEQVDFGNGFVSQRIMIKTGIKF